MGKHGQVKGRVAALCGIGHTGVAAGKAVIGVLSGSQVLLASAVHSASLALDTFTGVFGGKREDDKLTSNPSKRTHAISAAIYVFVAVMLLLACVEIGLLAVSYLDQAPTRLVAASAGYGLLICLVIQQSISAWQARKLSNRQTGIVSQRVSLVLSSLALAGISLTYVGQTYEMSELRHADSLSAMITVLVLFGVGLKRLKPAAKDRGSRMLQPEEVNEFMEFVQRVPGVIAINELKAKEQGHYVVVEIRMSVNPKVTVIEGQEIAKLIRHRLMSRYTHVSDVDIHVLPYDPGYPYKSPVYAEQEDRPTILH